MDEIIFTRTAVYKAGNGKNRSRGRPRKMRQEKMKWAVENIGVKRQWYREKWG